MQHLSQLLWNLFSPKTHQVISSILIYSQSTLFGVTIPELTQNLNCWVSFVVKQILKPLLLMVSPQTQFPPWCRCANANVTFGFMWRWNWATSSFLERAHSAAQLYHSGSVVVRMWRPACCDCSTWEVLNEEMCHHKLNRIIQLFPTIIFRTME